MECKIFKYSIFANNYSRGDKFLKIDNFGKYTFTYTVKYIGYMVCFSINLYKKNILYRDIQDFLCIQNYMDGGMHYSLCLINHLRYYKCKNTSNLLAVLKIGSGCFVDWVLVLAFCSGCLDFDTF